MNKQQFDKMRNGKGFIAALDQSGGSTPKALEEYGIQKNEYPDEDAMFDLVHAMRSRIITSPSFTSEKILGVILFEQTMDRTIDGMGTVDYLWGKKGIISFLKVDKGMADLSEGVQMMKPIPNLDKLLERAVESKVFGTKMRSVIKNADPNGIKKIVDQQFEIGRQIISAGLMPIIEPEVDIHSKEKTECERILKEEILKHLEGLSNNEMVMLKLSIPDENDFYLDLAKHPRVLRVVALSGGYSQDKAVKLLKQNRGLIASFSRALLEGLNVQQTDEEFNLVLQNSIAKIYAASIT